MADDLISPQPVLKPDAVFTIMLLAGGRVQISYPQNEMVARFMLDKAHSMLDEEFRPKVVDDPRVTGQLLQTMRRH